VLLTPNHGSFPAGHATQCHFLATILKELLKDPITGNQRRGGDAAAQLDALADRIGDNRVIAGVHYTEDIDEGAKLGRALGGHFIKKAKPAGNPATPTQWLWKKADGEQWV
jgi:hypothetical protein